MAGPNLLIGNGQVLAGTVRREVSGSSAKDFPYTIERARERLGPGIDLIAQEIDDLPDPAKPRGEGTGNDNGGGDDAPRGGRPDSSGTGGGSPRPGVSAGDAGSSAGSATPANSPAPPKND